MDPAQIPLRDLHLPETVSNWPPAPGWWFVIGVLLLGLAYLLRHWFRRHARGAVRRYAMRQLNALQAAYQQHRDAIRFGAEASELLRRTMLAYAPREDVAGLTGEAWLAWLDRDLAQPLFVTGAGRALLDLPYRNPQSEIPAAEVERLMVALRHRIATPVGGQR
ncbi:MAG: DUF4381 domain-containing protein [Gammaproteobacteria bacterium]|nr:DUF4381 domain-containing protein [Gammaproteobacteria bacterium]MDH5322741.1 DUF4381 domain-containing protein [Gammaproteobacteria bacterium]